MKILKYGTVVQFECSSCDCEFRVGIHVIRGNDANYYARCPNCGSECYSTAVLSDQLRDEDS